MSVSEDLLCAFELLKPLDGAALKKEMAKKRRSTWVPFVPSGRAGCADSGRQELVSVERELEIPPSPATPSPTRLPRVCIHPRQDTDLRPPRHPRRRRPPRSLPSRVFCGKALLSPLPFTFSSRGCDKEEKRERERWGCRFCSAGEPHIDWARLCKATHRQTRKDKTFGDPARWSGARFETDDDAF